jgi:hypothetical protein
MRLFVATALTGNGNVHEVQRRGSIDLARCCPDAIFESRCSSNIAENREELSLQFLRSSCSHLLFVDADVGFRAEHALRLGGRELDVVAGAYVKRWEDQSIPAAIAPGAVESADHLVECLTVPAGFLLLSRHALAAMYERYAEEGMWMVSREQYRYVSEDTMFCRRWRAIGGRIWLDGSVCLGHVGEKIFTVPRLG